MEQREFVVLERIANALERLAQAYPPIVPPTTTTKNTEVPIVREEPKASKDELTPKGVNDTTSNMHYRGQQLFYNCGFCDQACPKAKSCIEYQPGEKCIGWKTPNYRGKK